MSYLVSARKYRPQTFASVVGQGHITTALARAIARQRVPHALLFTGPRGVGKTTTARVFSKALNCTGRTIPPEAGKLLGDDLLGVIEPCGECTNCREVAKSSSLSVWEIDGASHNSVDNVRELIESLRSLPPPGSQYKIYIIDEVHMLSTAAFNAFLKSLEEPPPNVVFIFATTDPQKIPDTVISRCQRHDFRRLPLPAITQSLAEIAEDQDLKIPQEVVQYLARRAQGGMRDAQSMFDRLSVFPAEELSLDLAQRVFGALDRSFLLEIATAIFNSDVHRCFALLDRAFSFSVDIRTFAADWLLFWRDALWVKHLGNRKIPPETLLGLELSAEEFSELSAVVAPHDGLYLQRLFSAAEDLSRRCLVSPAARYVVEAGIVQMATLPNLRPIAELVHILETSEGIPEKKTVSPHAQQAEQPPADNRFNPSWEEFLNHVRGRSEVVLSAFLRRVSPRTFVSGKVEIEAADFDLQSLREPQTLRTLTNCLHSYSNIAHWEVRFLEHPQKQSELHSKNENAAFENTQGHARHLPGSLAAKEADNEKERRQRIEREAREHPMVQAALTTFEGSTIEKISPVKR